MNHRMRIQNRRLRPNSGDPLEHNIGARRRREWRRTDRKLRQLTRAFKALDRAASAVSVSMQLINSGLMSVDKAREVL